MCLAADQAMHRENTVIGRQALRQSNIIVSLLTRHQQPKCSSLSLSLSAHSSERLKSQQNRLCQVSFFSLRLVLVITPPIVKVAGIILVISCLPRHPPIGSIILVALAAFLSRQPSSHCLAAFLTSWPVVWLLSVASFCVHHPFIR